MMSAQSCIRNNSEAIDWTMMKLSLCISYLQSPFFCLPLTVVCNRIRLEGIIDANVFGLLPLHNDLYASPHSSFLAHSIDSD